MPRVIALSGSLRRGSFNSALLRAAAELAPPDLQLEIASIRDFPVYDGDLEASSFPAAVTELKDRIAAADGLLVASPEYNSGIPGPLKNAIDWLSRPASDIARVFHQLPFGLVGATPGPGGTRIAQIAWQPVVRYLVLRPFWAKAVYLNGAGQAFDADGRLIDDRMRGIVRDYLAQFGPFVAENRRRR